MAGWHHWLNGRESEWTPGVGDGQGGLAYCDSWGCKGSDMTERLNWTEWIILIDKIGKNINIGYPELESSFLHFSWDHKHYSLFGWWSSHTHTHTHTHICTHKEGSNKREKMDVYRWMFQSLDSDYLQSNGNIIGHFLGTYVNVLFAFVEWIHWY